MNENSVEPAPRYPQLRTIEGPWNADVWLIERPLRYETAGNLECAVEACARPAGKALGDKPRPDDILCLAHRRRRAKMPSLPSVSDFIAEAASTSPILRPRGAVRRIAYYQPIEFTLIHPRLAGELRFVTGVRVNRNSWRNAEYVNSVLRAAIAVGSQIGADSVVAVAEALEAPDPRWSRRGAKEFIGGRNLRNLRLAMPAMLKALENATLDPWDATIWHAKDLQHHGVAAAAQGNISWQKVTCTWFREGARRLAREDLQSGRHVWSTVRGYVRAGSVLSAFVEEQAGGISPTEMSHQVILELLSWLRDKECVREDFVAVNVLVNLLYRLRDTGIQPDLPNTLYMRRGDNPISKKRKPKPFPPDLLERIDALIAARDVWPDDVHLMMRLFRAAGPRATEALQLPPNCVTFASGRGYTLEYFMTKVDDWRRIPLPPKLGEDLVAHQLEMQRDHPDSPFLFPYFGPSPRTNVLAHRRSLYSPWPYTTFTSLVWTTYRERGIVTSGLTGEKLTGAQLHRFRHTVATGFLNEGWSQYEVQKFLGHKSPTMMQSYAEIHDDTLRLKYDDYLHRSVGIDGKPAPALSGAEVEVERLRGVMVRATLPNGYCGLPEKQDCTFLPSPCLSCPFFKTTPKFLPIHIRQRDDSLRELDLAREDGRSRAVEAHLRTAETLTKIIDGLNEVVA